jgi:Zn-dependent protease
MKCQKCGTETFLPFRCQYCHNYFCSEHRLPENHQCPQIEQARKPLEQAPQTNTQQQTGYDYTVTYGPHTSPNRKLKFSKRELRDLTIAALLVVAVGLSFSGFSTFSNYILLTLFIIIFTLSFFIHEIAHKAIAQRSGLWAEFRLTIMGALFTLISALLPIKFISPGAVMIAGYADKKQTGTISIAGPATNIILSMAFLGAAFLPIEFAQAFALGAAFNAWIALFNLIPFGILDGLKVYNWNKKIWVSIFGASIVLTAISYKLILF